MGFERYGGFADLQYFPSDAPPPEPVSPLPESYRIDDYHPSDWRETFEFTKRVRPAIEQQYKPVN